MPTDEQQQRMLYQSIPELTYTQKERERESESAGENERLTGKKDSVEMID